MELNNRQKATLKALNLEVVSFDFCSDDARWMSSDGGIYHGQSVSKHHIVRPAPALKLPAEGSAAWALCMMAMGKVVVANQGTRYRYGKGRFEYYNPLDNEWLAASGSDWRAEPFRLHTEPPPPPTLAEVKAAVNKYRQVELLSPAFQEASKELHEILSRIPDETEGVR